ncbi:MAG: AraC family transcriptional regulator [Cellvibrionaceae bacterium]|nr:AraC family transcriptional regulator [Cellvibrionaceae bacterium]
MESLLKFIDHNTGKPSSCGEVLDIEISSRSLGWRGIVVEKGSSPHFYPSHVSTPYFYFALGLEQDLNWQADTEGVLSELHTIPGEIWINPPATPFTHSIDEPCYFLIVAIEKQRFIDACPIDLQGKQLRFLKNYNVQDDSLRATLELFLHEVQALGRNGPAYLENLLSLLAVHYINNYSDYLDKQKEQEDGSKFSHQELEKIDKLIAQNISRSITIEEMAGLLNCSKFYFLREFKKLTGVTPYQYLINQRLALSREKLLAGNKSISSVAIECGFNDQAHFTRAFKKQYHTTPSKLKP